MASRQYDISDLAQWKMGRKVLSVCQQARICFSDGPSHLSPCWYGMETCRICLEFKAGAVLLRCNQTAVQPPILREHHFPAGENGDALINVGLISTLVSMI